MYNRNAAFDFKTLEERKFKREGKIVRLPSKEARRKEKLRAQKIILNSIFSAFFGVVMGVSGFIAGQARLTEVVDKYSKASKQLEECKSANTGLEMKLKEICGSVDKSEFNENSRIELVKVHKDNIAEIK